MSENRIERAEPGDEFTVMTLTGEALDGLLSVRGTTTSVDGGEEWFGVVVLPDRDDEAGDDGGT